MKAFTELEIQEYAYNKKIEELDQQNMDQWSSTEMFKAENIELKKQLEKSSACKNQLADKCLELIAENIKLKGDADYHKKMYYDVLEKHYS